MSQKQEGFFREILMTAVRDSGVEILPRHLLQCAGMPRPWQEGYPPLILGQEFQSMETATGVLGGGGDGDVASLSFAFFALGGGVSPAELGAGGQAGK